MSTWLLVLTAARLREAALLYFRCHRAGVMIRSTVDCPIVRTAIEHGQVFLHNASTFDDVEKVIPELNLA